MAYIEFVVLSTEEDVQVIHKQKSRNNGYGFAPPSGLEPETP